MSLSMTTVKSCRTAGAVVGICTHDGVYVLVCVSVCIGMYVCVCVCEYVCVNVCV